MIEPAKAAMRPPRVAHVQRGIGGIEVRRFDSRHDSFEQLTEMLHRSFARLGGMGLNCTCVDQTARVTEQRAKRGECYVAVCDGRVVGTMTLYAPDRESVCERYQRAEVASVRQLGVDPSYQNRGIGKSLLAFAQRWAAMRGYAELALDTPQPAAHLVAFYRAQGFRLEGFQRFAGKRYDSAILCKPTVAARTLAAWAKTLDITRRAWALAA
jgi:GNAT superfamily N-acetyltransferase